MQLPVKIRVEGEQGGGHGGGDGEGDEGGEAAGAAMDKGAEKQAREGQVSGLHGRGPVPEGIDLRLTGSCMAEKPSCRGHLAFGLARRGRFEDPGLRSENTRVSEVATLQAGSGIGAEDVGRVHVKGGADGGGTAGDGDDESEGEDDGKKDGVE